MRAAGPHPNRGAGGTRLRLLVSLTVLAGTLVLLFGRPDELPEATRAVYGAVVNDAGDPLPAVTLCVPGGRRAESNLHGEFCVFVARGCAMDIAAHRAGFAPATIHVPVSGGDFEALLRMRPTVATTARERRFFVTDALWCGLPAALVRVYREGVELTGGGVTSRCDGCVTLPGLGDDHGRLDVEVRTKNGSGAWARTVRLIDGDALPVHDTESAPRRLEVTFAGPDAPRDGSSMSVFDDTRRSPSRGEIIERRAVGTSHPGSGAWVHFDDGRVAGLRKLHPNDDGTAQVTCGPGLGALEILGATDLIDAAPVLVPAWGEPRVVFGELMTDLPGGAAHGGPEIPLRRLGERLRSPLLDLDVGAASLRPGNGDRDVRILADLLSLEREGDRFVARDVRVASGTASVRVRLQAGEPGAGFFATLARRGGPYALRQRVRSGGEAQWPQLCAGAYLLVVERSQAERTDDATRRVQVFENVRRVLVGPGEAVTVEVRLSYGHEAQAVLREQRR